MASFIGKPSVETGFTKKNWFYLKSAHDKGGAPDGSNVYRILPPLHSLAASGKWFAYLATHTVKNSEGKPRSFVCLRDKDRHGNILSDCPFCRMLDANTATYNAMTQQGVAKEMLSTYRKQFIEPYDVEKKIYMNVVDLNNQIGNLAVGYKFFQTIKAEVGLYISKGIAVNDIEGIYFNFKKIAPFKGSRDTQYQFELYREGGPLSNNFKKHVCTEEFIARLEKESFDLPNMFKFLTDDQVSMLVDIETRAAIVDGLWSAGEMKKAQTSNPLSVNVGGTNMQAVGHIQMTPNGPVAHMPNVNQIQAAQAPAPQAPAYTAPTYTTNMAPAPQAPVAEPMNGQFNPYQAQQFLAQAAQYQTKPQAQAQPVQAPQPMVVGSPNLAPQTFSNGMSESDFENTFGNMN